MKKKDLKLAKAALYQYELLRIEHIEALPQVEFIPTSRYTEEMSKLLENPSNLPTEERHISCRRRTLILITAAIILSLLVTACAFANKIKGFFVNLFDSFAAVTHDTNDNEIINIYKMGYTPEGYQETKFITSNKIVFTLYHNQDYMIEFRQNNAYDFNIKIDIQNKDYTTKILNDLELYIVKEQNYNYIYWSNEKYMFYLSCHESLEWEDVEKMILSIYCEDR